jgi:hypothetical protein
MAESVDTLMREFLSWVSTRPRTYEEAMEAWQSHCPRQTIWEDAMIAGLIQLTHNDTCDETEVTLTALGKALLNGGNGHR